MRNILPRGFHNTLAASLAVMLACGSMAIADDTEIFTAYAPADSSTNVVFIIDTSGSMGNHPANDNSSPTKIQIVKNVFEKLIFDPANPTDHSTLNPNLSGINIALMRFDNRSGSANKGGYFISAMKELNDANKISIWDSVNGLQDDGNTPLAETLYEAALYFNGAAPKFGKSTEPGTNVDAVMNADKSLYISPFEAPGIEHQCAINNHIVLLTDGQPTRDGDADTDINTLTGNMVTVPATEDEAEKTEISALGCTFKYNEQLEKVEDDCLPDVAKYLHDKDFLPLNDQKDPNVKTHTIAFDLNVDDAVALLKETAIKGGGLYKSASNATQLGNAINQILRGIDNTAKTFVSPSVSLSSANRLQHDQSMYYALFKPAAAPKWTGNLKGYQLNKDGQLLDFSTPPKLALSTDTIEFIANATSKWSGTADGDDIAKGGAASKITTSRTIKTHDGSNLQTFDSTNVTDTDLGVATTAEHTALIQWAKGLNADDTVRANPIGDPLHSTPVVVDYGGSTGKIIFFGTNEGFLHAIDADTGVEKFAFIPRELLGNLKIFKENTASTRPYGLDGPITVFVDDVNGDGIIDHDADVPDHVYLYIGMRRGGNQYYALNVSDIDTPSFLWQINPNAENSKFSGMGQTWSKPIVTKIKTGDQSSPVIMDVLLFAGGYDPRYDDISATVSNATGAAIYAVGARDGLLKWLASSASGTAGTFAMPELTIDEMVNSIPSDLAILDLDGDLDQVANRIYAADIQGNIFRIDLDNIDSTTEDYTPVGKLLANLSGNNRRFYHSPEAVLTKYGLKQYVTINIGSGFRAHPLYISPTGIKDRFYSIQDGAIFTPLPSDYTAFTTDNLVSVSTMDASTVLDKGWYYELTRAGEKVLAKSTTTNYQTVFTTYTPPEPVAPGTITCVPPTGTGRYYYINSFAPNNNLTEAKLSGSGIPPTPSVILTGGDTVTIEDPNDPDQTITTRLTPRVQVCVGLECQPLDTTVILDRTFWQQLL